MRHRYLVQLLVGLSIGLCSLLAQAKQTFTKEYSRVKDWSIQLCEKGKPVTGSEELEGVVGDDIIDYVTAFFDLVIEVDPKNCPKDQVEVTVRQDIYTTRKMMSGNLGIFSLYDPKRDITSPPYQTGTCQKNSKYYKDGECTGQQWISAYQLTAPCAEDIKGVTRIISQGSKQQQPHLHELHWTLNYQGEGKYALDVKLAQNMDATRQMGQYVIPNGGCYPRSSMPVYSDASMSLDYQGDGQKCPPGHPCPKLDRKRLFDDKQYRDLLGIIDVPVVPASASSP